MRLCYLRRDGEHVAAAIAEVTDRMEFFDQEPGEVRWHPFTPSAQEMAEVNRLILDGGTTLPDWSIRIDVDELAWLATSAEDRTHCVHAA